MKILIGDIAFKEVVAEIMEVGCFSNALDEIADTRSKDQASFCLRHVHRASGVATERAMQSRRRDPRASDTRFPAQGHFVHDHDS